MKSWWSKLRESRGVGAVAVAVLAGVAIALLLVPVLPGPGDEPPAAPQVQLLGQRLPLDDNAIGRALERVRQYVQAPIELELPDGKIHPVFFGRLGALIDKVRLAALVRAARDPTSRLRRGFAERPKNTVLSLPVPLVLEPSEGEATLLALKDDVDRLPSDARLDLETRKLVHEVSGQLLDVDATWLAIERAASQGERRVPVVVEKVPPRRVAADLANVEFDTVLGYFETHYDRSARSRDRTYNLRLAASKLDGHVLLPKETFDFNDVVGPRDEANGYKVATVIAEGELVDGIGGGTCQISGTLHGAVFFSGLDIVERVPHTRPSSYIKVGLDATVVYPTINFRFRNPFDFPVVLHETVKNGVVRAEILGPNRPRTVTLIRHITDVVPYEQIERPDPQLPSGVRVLGQRGVPGFSVTRYRIVRNGAHAVRERWQDKYPQTPQILRVGTGDMPKDQVNAKDDPHPEYLADELLVMTQGLDPGDDPGSSKDPGGTTLEWRHPGRTGEPGWTRKENMPQWRNETKSASDQDKSARGRPGNG